MQDCLRCFAEPAGGNRSWRVADPSVTVRHRAPSSQHSKLKLDLFGDGKHLFVKVGN